MRSIFLTGFSGTGKSTVARHLGEQLGLPVRDLDAMIVAGAGRSIPDIFANDGEPAFRQRESAQLRRLTHELATQPAVVATGGGVPTIDENCALMAATGWIITLDATPEAIYARLREQLGPDGRGERRPLLDFADPLDRIRALKAARRAAYARAHWRVQTDRATPVAVAAEIACIITRLEETGGQHLLDTAQPSAFPFGKHQFGQDRPLVCVPIVATDPAQALAQAAEIVALAPDAIELRADYLADCTPAAIAALLPQLAATGLPILFTNRATAEGGATQQSEEARIAALEAAIETGLPALVDLELATAAPLRARILTASRRHRVPVIFSFHDFSTTPEDAVLLAQVAAMQAAGADAAKLAVMPRHAGDAVRLLALCRDLTTGARGGLAIPLAAMSMGPLGMLTRVLGHQAGSALTFAAVAPGGGSAPGQLAVEELRACWAATSTA